MNRKWLFPLSCVGLCIISFLPIYTSIPYDPRNTPDVIFSILSVSLLPYQDYGWIFHVATLILILSIIWKPRLAGRVLPAYIGANTLIIASLQTHAVTDKYGLAIQTGALIGTAIIGMIWLVVSIRGDLKVSLRHFRYWHYALLPLVLLSFWAPVKVTGDAVIPNFDPRLLLTSVDYGLAYCFVTPVFLFLLIIFTTNYTSFPFRISAFNALLYGLFNLTHWFDSKTVWMGVMHLPLLIISLVALLLPYLKRSTAKTDLLPKTLTTIEPS